MFKLFSFSRGNQLSQPFQLKAGDERHLDAITADAKGYWRMPDDSRDFFSRWLAAYGQKIENFPKERDLLAKIRELNAIEFREAVGELKRKNPSLWLRLSPASKRAGE